MTTSTSTTTTTIAVCDCDGSDGGFAFFVRRLGKFNNDSLVAGSIGANEERGLVRFGKRVFMPDGTNVTADRVKIGSGTSLFDLHANIVLPASDAVVRGVTTGPVTLPLIDPFCSLPPITCGGPDVFVPSNATLVSLAPGTYGNLFMKDGATLQLPIFGTYTFCSIKMGNNTALRPSQQVTINVAGDVRIGSGAVLASDSNAPFILNVAGKKVRISQGTVVNAKITAPNAKIKIQRGGTIAGCTCSDGFTTDKNIQLLCAGGSPSGAFVDF